MTDPSGYEVRLRRLSGRLAGMLDALRERYESGQIDLDAFADLAAILVTTANGQAAGLARLSIGAYIASQTGGPLPALTAGPPEWRTDPDRVRAGVTTIATGTGAALAGRLARLAKAEPANAAAETYAEVIGYWDTDVIDGWTRQLDSDPCDLCEWWAAESHKFSPTARMPRHDGCLCTQIPSITT